MLVFPLDADHIVDRVEGAAIAWAIPLFADLVDRADVARLGVVRRATGAGHVRRPVDLAVAAAQRALNQVRRPFALHPGLRSEEHTSELQSLMRISYAVFCLKKKKDVAITYTRV